MSTYLEHYRRGAPALPEHAQTRGHPVSSDDNRQESVAAMLCALMDDIQALREHAGSLEQELASQREQMLDQAEQIRILQMVTTI